MKKVEEQRKIVISAALPYANGSIHIGHILEYVQADILARFQKMRGHDCLYVCADDTHGTPIMVRARKEGIAPEALIAKMSEEHQSDFKDFEISFDHYSSTNSPVNKELCHEIFKSLEINDTITTKDVEQSYCEHDKMFLPDRFVVGECPKCGAVDQYGDSCDVCSSTYTTFEVVNAKCSICGNKPIAKTSKHVFFQLHKFSDFLKEWVPKHTQKEVSNKLKEWLDEELMDWDISRDDPYFGFEIPGHDGQFFYVWVDAPMGYITSTKEWCEKNGKDFDSYWVNEGSEIYHIIGKDIMYFHCLFWPAMLKGSRYRTPTKVMVHGFVGVNGQKMSKSKGTFISARTYLNHLDPMYLRYYYASKLSPSVDDIDLNVADMAQRVNSELIGKITNVASRGIQMLHKKLDGKVGALDEEGLELLSKAREHGKRVAKYYEEFEFAKAIAEIRSIAELANRYFDTKEPWKTIKDDPEGARPVLTAAVNLFRVMAIYLKPVLPEYVINVEKLLGEEFNWASAMENFEEKPTQPYKHLATRMDEAAFEAMIDESKVGEV